MSQSDIHNQDHLPEPIAPMSENFTGESASNDSQDAETVEMSSESLPDSDSSAVAPEEREWETVNLPNSMNVDELEVAESEESAADLEAATTNESAASDPLPTEDRPETIADRIMAAQESEEIDRPESADVELYQRIEHLETLLARYQRSLDEQQLSARSQQVEIDVKITQLQGAQEQVNQLSQELEICQSEIRSSQQAIATLKENWQQSQERLAQIERECATTQQRYNQQVQLNLQAVNTCRELRARLHRQQRQALQFKAALEKSLTHKEAAITSEFEGVVPTQYSTQLPHDFSTAPPLDPTADLLEVSPGTVVPKSAPIKPWSNGSEASEFGSPPEATPIEFDPPSPESLSVEPTASTDSVPSAGSDHLPMPNPASETFWPEEDNLIQTIRDLVSTESSEVTAAPNSASESVSEINLPTDEAVSNPEALAIELNDEFNSELTSADGSSTDPEGSDTDSDPESDLNSQVQLDNYLWDLPEVSDPVDTQSDPETVWPAPVVYPQRSMKKRRSLAAVELPSFPTKQ